MGLDSREVTPVLTAAVIHLAAEIRSFARTERATERVLLQKVSASTVRRLTREVGLEFSAFEDADEPFDDKEVVVPEIAVVSCDGGRIRTREPGQGRGVTVSGEQGWRETKNASFEKMCAPEEHVAGIDSCPELPTTFRVASKVANIAEKPAPELSQSTEEPDESNGPKIRYEGSKRILRTALSSMARSADFGPKMKNEAKRRGFFKASLRAFLGDGLNWNWSIWETHFSNFIPILDFIHAVTYVFEAAMCIGSTQEEGWNHCLQFMQACWKGEVAQVIQQLRTYCEQHGISLDSPDPNGPHEPITTAIRYLTNNQSRMDYPRYRQLGLPVTSAPMESLIKQINLRVKGTEMFWDDPTGAEAILTLRAAALSEDNRLADYLDKRPGHPFRRRTTVATTETAA